MGARIVVEDVLVEVVTKKGRSWHWHSVKKWRLRTPEGRVGVRIELDVSGVRGGEETIKEALRQLKEAGAIGMSYVEPDRVLIMCMGGYRVVRALLASRKLNSPYVDAICTKLKERLDAIDQGK